MPVLPPEADQFPENLMSELKSDDCQGRDWWAVYVKPRQEKAMARHLYNEGVPFYLPLIVSRGKYRHRMLTAHLPLFPGYLFIWATPDERTRALAANRAVRTLRPPDRVKFCNDLRQIYKLITSGVSVAEEDRVVRGDLVEIKSGPLAGMQGTILEVGKRRSFIIQVDFIQRAAKVELEEGVMLEVIERW